VLSKKAEDVVPMAVPEDVDHAQRVRTGVRTARRGDHERLIAVRCLVKKCGIHSHRYNSDP
jgi:hypothetical protein